MRRHLLSVLMLFAAGAQFSPLLLRAQETAPPATPPVATVDTVTSPDVAPAAKAPSSSPLEIAEQLYRTGKLDAAAQQYNTLLQSVPNSTLAYVGLSRVYLKQKRPDDAYKAASKAVELTPGLAAAHVVLGEVYFRQGKIAQAEHEFTAQVQAGTSVARAYWGLARVYRVNSYYQHAKIMIDQAHTMDPADPDIRRDWMATLSRKERIKELAGYLGDDTDDDQEDRERMEHGLVLMTQEEESRSKSCRVVSKVSSTEMPLETLMQDAQHLRAFGLKVSFNGASSRLLLDTGASGFVIDRKVAEKAGIQRIVKGNVSGIGDKGAAAGYFGRADSVKIGEVEFQECLVSVIEKSSVADGDGLIGADVFSAFLVDLDFANIKFRLSPLPPLPAPSESQTALAAKYPASARFHDRYVAPEMKSYTPMVRVGHNLLIATKINDLPPKLFLIDTGAFGNTIAPDAAKEATKVHKDSDIHVKGLSGEVKNVFQTDELTLTFSHYKQRALGLVAFDTSPISNSLGTEVSGMLGFVMLRMMEMKIDYRDGLIDFGFDANRFH